jgi:hypothetical protein
VGKFERYSASVQIASSKLRKNTAQKIFKPTHQAARSPKIDGEKIKNFCLKAPAAGENLEEYPRACLRNPVDSYMSPYSTQNFSDRPGFYPPRASFDLASRPPN